MSAYSAACNKLFGRFGNDDLPAENDQSFEPVHPCQAVQMMLTVRSADNDSHAEYFGHDEHKAMPAMQLSHILGFELACDTVNAVSTNGPENDVYWCHCCLTRGEATHPS